MKTKITFPKMTLVQKVIAGYAVMAFFSMASLTASIAGIYNIAAIVRDMVRTDLAALQSIYTLREALTAEERYASKYIILRSPELADLFRKRGTEFTQTLSSLKKQSSDLPLSRLITAHQEFTTTSERMFGGKDTDPRPIHAASIKAYDALDQLASHQNTLISRKLTDASNREHSTISLTLILSLSGFLLALVTAALIIHNISSSIRKLRAGTMRIAEGDFDYDPAIPPGDEIGSLAGDFKKMAVRLKEMEQISLDASPLTRLPGNIAIERILTKKLAATSPFAVCYADLDNFKAYNDRYGYIKASELIKVTGEIIHNATRNLAETDSFVGHVGGDDFVIVADADKAAPICEAIIEKFDTIISGFYSDEDLANGGIQGLDRYGVERTFPIMAISIAVIICRKGEYDSAVEIARNAAQIKEHVKGQAGSTYFINRRRLKR
jgi:GGDEF domain-containing protein